MRRAETALKDALKQGQTRCSGLSQFDPRNRTAARLLASFNGGRKRMVRLMAAFDPKLPLDQCQLFTGERCSKVARSAAMWGDDIGQLNMSIFTKGMMDNDRIGEEGLLFTDYYAEQSCTAGRVLHHRAEWTSNGLTKVGMPGAGMRAQDPTNSSKIVVNKSS